MSLDIHALSVGRLERVIALRGFPGYHDLPPADVARIAARMGERRYKAGAIVQKEGKPLTHFHFVIRGEVEIRRGGRLLRRLGARSIVGGTSALAGDPKGYEIVAVKDTVTLRMAVEDALEVFEEHFEMVQSVVTRISGEILGLRRQLAESGYGFVASTWRPEGAPPAPLDLVGRVAALREALPFAGTRMEALVDLARDVEEVRFEDPIGLWERGHLSDAFYIVRWGAVRGEPEEGAPLRFGPGDVVGSLGTLSRQPRWYRAITEGVFVAIRVERDTLFDVLEDHFSLARAMIRALAGGMLSLMDRNARVADATTTAP
ncbi:MAG TPA: cyclic nucleotide-binding domain-containing protein [Polyangiaceae bacterium LLY-WYZ-15_(1-7)]|nr:hypothetical protein [Myxococcales bacterium]MAT29739.1 hypothetical protein [Sandaracinus sp.]HJK95162.1 cyclic nucleotide-binding domain-containing protein [Polyangiaceae bacterium LLY-WYZ-15_(1-7)]MBJ72211.1 hypothetical protein [Sandaracinus sp.]HJL04737.1 cyclic nucleotide-binding domain-containing protein [Polyangiaceae bacterium LLY-WYZ-15_(1-7)]